MNIPIPEGETLIEVMEFSAPHKLSFKTRIETCRGEFRAVIILNREIIYTERAATQKQAESITPDYIDWVYVQRRKGLFAHRNVPFVTTCTGRSSGVIPFPATPTIGMVRA